MGIHISVAALENCINPESYGVICVRCNACGRWNKETQMEDKRKLYEEYIESEERDLKEAENKVKNIKSNIKYFKDKLKEEENING